MVNISRRNFLAASGTGVTVGLTGCTSSITGGDTQSMSIALSVPNWSPYAPVRYAEQEGYFEEFDVEVEITAYGGGGEAQNALASGEEDLLSFNGAGVALAVASGVEEQIVAGEQIVPHGWTLDVHKDTDIESMMDLEGGDVGVTSRSATTDVHALGAADDAGVNIETIPVGASGLVSGVQEGQVDASSMFPPLNFVAKSEGWRRTIYDFSDLGSTLPAVWVASQETIDNNPEGLEGALNAIFKATKYMQQNESESVEFLMEYTDNPEAIVQRSYDEILSQITDNGDMDISQVQNALDLARLTDADELPEPEEMFTDQFLPIDVSVN